MISGNEFISIATIGRAVGLKGWCRVFPTGKTLFSLKLPYNVIVGNVINDKNIRLTIKKIDNKSKVCRIFFEGINTREKADELKNMNIFIPFDELPEPEEDEFYHFELEGMNVYFDDDKENIVGHVLHVYNYPTSDALEIKMRNNKIVVVPFKHNAVPHVSREQKAVFVNRDFLEELL